MSDLSADELLKRGDKKMMTTLTRWKPDYEAAAAAYEEAGSKFRAKGRTKDAMLAFEKCAEANGKEDNEWHAAKSFEMCALLAKDCAGVDETVAYAQRACEAYVIAGRAQRGAECLGKCAKFMDESAPTHPARLLDAAISCDAAELRAAADGDGGARAVVNALKAAVGRLRNVVQKKKRHLDYHALEVEQALAVVDGKIQHCVLPHDA